MLSKFKIFITKNEYGYFIFYFILMLGATFFELLGIGSIPIFLMSILNQEKLISYLPSELVNEMPFVLEKNFQLIVGISLVVVFILKNSYLIYFNYFQGKLKINLRKKIKNKVLKESKELFDSIKIKSSWETLVKESTSRWLFKKNELFKNDKKEKSDIITLDILSQFKESVSHSWSEFL